MLNVIELLLLKGYLLNLGGGQREEIYSLWLLPKRRREGF